MGRAGGMSIGKYHSARKGNNAMAFVPVNDTVSAEIRMTLDGQKIENTLYFHKVGGWEVPDTTDLGGDLLIWWNTYYRVPLSNRVALREIYLTDLSSEDSFTVTQPAPAPAPVGPHDLEPAPNNVCLCVSFRTARRGRSYRGRNYISGFPRDFISSNDLDTAKVEQVITAYEALFPVMSAWGGEWVVVSRFHDNAPRVMGVHQPILAVVVTDPTVDSQRRRLPGRGT